MKSSRGVRKVNPKRRAKEWARAYGSKERVAFVQSLKCIAATTMCTPKIDVAHIESGGMGRKADADKTVPLCRYHHRMLHQWGIVEFFSIYGVDLGHAAAEIERQWQEASA